ncbi:aromatic motif membrane protein [Mycoplasma procyoni]|uniref:aromatic motif membrane protein n=1 Tax=Mycoplasma procyoni TaxID=568784 RepID=UPI00197CB3EE|nr:aromatic motif membrane protein [Mycoplasma procyoni]MBN3534870.1 hypothetical protein [Mycoplasma procyoni]
MKKRTKIALSFLSTAPLLPLVSCAQAKETKVVDQNLAKNQFYQQAKISGLLNDAFNNDKNLVNNYIFQQENINFSHIQELKFALSVYNPNRPIFLDRLGSQNKPIISLGREIFYEDFSKNWYWILKNLKFIKFAHYPYPLNGFKANNFGDKSESDYFSEESNNILEFNSSDLSDFFVIKTETDKDVEFVKKAVYYLLIDKNKVVRLQKFTRKDDSFVFRLDHDLFEINKLENFSLENFAKEFEANLNTKVEQKIKAEKEEFDEELTLEEDEDNPSSPEELQKKKEEQYKKIEQKYSSINYNTKEEWAFLNWNYDIFKELEEKYSLKKFMFRNVDPAVIEAHKNQNTSNSNPDQNTNNIPDIFKKFIDTNLDIYKKVISPEEIETKKVIDTLLNEIFNKDKDKINVFVKSQEENKEKIQQQFVDFAKKINTDTTDFRKSGLFNEYKKLVSDNWYFVLNNLVKFKSTFSNWFLLPDKQKTDKDGHLLAPSQAYLDKVENADYYEVTYFSNNYLNQIQEGDTSLINTSYKDFYIKKNNQIFNIRLSLKKEGNEVEFIPLTIYFGKAKTKFISIASITSIIHNGIFHDSYAHYQAFENELVDKYGYGIPAEMLFIWKETKNEQKDN